jgi:preprotein translocase subunit SecG
MLHTLLTIIDFFCAAAIVALVLLQRGKGAEAGAGFGSGASGTVFGARGATTALSRATAILVAIFMITSAALFYVDSHIGGPSSSSLLDRLSQQQNAPAHSAPAPAAAPAPSPPAASSSGAAGAAPASPAAAGAAAGSAAGATPSAPTTGAPAAPAAPVRKH